MEIDYFCKKYNLGTVLQVEKLAGGLMHKMRKVQTDQGIYAIKILNPEVMSRKGSYENFIKSEEISNLAKHSGITVSSAILIQDSYINKFKEQYYMVFEYVEGKILTDDQITVEHCKKIAQALVKIHSLDNSNLNLDKTISEYKSTYLWDEYLKNKNFSKMPYKELYLKNYRKYNSIMKRVNERFNESNQIKVLCHRDLDPKNVLWNKETPIIIDWESAGFSNPYQELIEVALSWSGFLSGNFNEDKFKAIIEEYVKYRKFEHKRYFTICGNLVGRFEWLWYNLERSLGIKTQDSEEVELAKKEVTKVILEINRYLQLIGPMYKIICQITKEEDKKEDQYIETLLQEIPMLKGKKYTKINRGFTNTIYSVGEYIVRICTNRQNEEKFRNEIAFYERNQQNLNIPKSYMSDITNTIIPYHFQIIEKIDGKTLYEIWYQLSKKEKKNILIKIIEALKPNHHFKGKPYDFSKDIKEIIQTEIKGISLDKKVVKRLLLCCEVWFKENNFGMIHGDLHFDNIIYKEGTIYLIDFERSRIAPIDYDFKILNRCQQKPWVWANEQTDMLTIEDDYYDIMSIVIENYEELRNIPYLKNRLAVYELIEDLKEYNKEQKEYQREKIERTLDALGNENYLEIED